MENPFKKVIHNEKLPEIIRTKVIDDINMIKLTLDVADLFVVKFPDTIGETLKKKQ
ncbi:MAG: hypothetical protein ACK5M1_14310 [Xanthomarina gelatinilytica]|uniref:hypothetical protein n=1 Tax=Xanthomarina gelatinilytica TaxID=1137281 RepID=UPI003A841DD2